MTRPVDIFKYEKTKEPGESYFEIVEDGTGVFHAFGVDYEELEDGPGNFSTAIVELHNGTVVNLPVELIKFSDTPTKANKNI